MGCNSSTSLPSNNNNNNNKTKKNKYKNISSSSSSILNNITYDDGISQNITINEPLKTLERHDFNDFTYVQTGGAGKVFLASRKNDNKKYAMKFFGYTSKQPKLNDIEREITLMQALKGIPNVVQIEGKFMDSKEGYVPNRIYDQPYPVIVMEALEGGDLFERIQLPDDIMTERFLASAFRGVIEALHHMHQRCLIHRDLKLENLIYATKASNSPIKVVDFGMMMKVSSPTGIFMSLNVEGTAGYCAPESYLKRQYSCQSDVWQAGCCLYSMLSGFAAFPQDDITKITSAQYSPMVGIGWDTISEPAKDLIRHILVKDPNKRYTTTDILAHEWLQGNAPTVELDSGYRKRISKLALRIKMKILFLDENIQTLSKTRKELLIKTLPFLENQQKRAYECKYNSSSQSSGSIPGLNSQSTIHFNTNDQKTQLNQLSTSPSTIKQKDGSSSHASDINSNDPNLKQKIKYLKTGLLYSISPFGPSDNAKVVVRKTASYTLGTKIPCNNNNNNNNNSSNNSNNNNNQIMNHRSNSIHTNSAEPNSMNILRRISDTSLYNTHNNYPSSWTNINLSKINFTNFVIILEKVDLPQLATQAVFDIFDKEGTGVIDMKEFLLTIMTLHPHNSSNEIDAVHLFFNFFDVKESGYIDLEDIKLVVGCLLAEDIQNQSNQGEPITVKNVEELFHTIDQEKRGKINFEEFQVFFNTVLRSTTIISTHS